VGGDGAQRGANNSKYHHLGNSVDYTSNSAGGVQSSNENKGNQNINDFLIQSK